MNYKKYLLQFIFFILCNEVVAQVPVREEPHHKPVLENDYIRLLDVHINPGDTTLYHIHAAPSVIVFISKSVMGAQIMNQSPAQPGEVLPAQTRFIDYDKNPVTHRVYNSGNNVFHVMDIELVKKQPSPDSCIAIQQNNIETTINEKLVRVYKFDLTGHQSLPIPKSNCAYLLVCITGKINITNREITTGEYLFFDPGSAIVLGNGQKDHSTFVLLQLK